MLGFRTGKPELWSETEEEVLCLEEGGSSKKLPRAARSFFSSPLSLIFPKHRFKVSC